MKLSSLLLGTAALLASGAAFAADLPAKKAAPAAAATGCPAFGPGFFQIPGSDTCIQFTGYMAAFYRTQYDTPAQAPYAFTSSFRLITDVRSNTEMGVLRGFSRLDNGALSYAYAQFAGLTAGQAQSAFALYALDFQERIKQDYYNKTNLINYTASIGGASTVTVGLEDSSSAGSGNMASTSATSHTPDVVGNVRFVNGPLTFHVSGATHQLSTATTGTNMLMGYAGMAGLKYKDDTAGTTAYLTGSYAYGALAYLGNPVVGSSSNVGAGNVTLNGLTAIYDSNASLSAVNSGYEVSAAVKQVAGPNGSYVFGEANYVSVTDNVGGTGVYNVGTTEIGYSWSPVKNIQILPSILFAQLGGTSAYNGSSTVARLSIYRNF